MVTRQEIISAGIVRLSDVLHLADRWSTATIDGYTWHAQASGLSPLSNPRWEIIVDGISAGFGLLGTQSLDALPIHVNEIECAELIARPYVAAGALRQAGTLRIQTRRPNAGMTLGASVSARNEVNDPGPFAYTPLASENVDRIGPIGTGTIEIRSGGRFARLTGKLDEFHFTDTQVNLRARQLYDVDSKPRIYTSAIALTAGIDGRLGTQRILAGRGETNDLLFFETFGLEIPVLRRVDFAGAEGRLRLGGGELRYHGRYISHELLERQNTRGINLDFHKRVISGGAESRIGSGPVHMTIGGSFDHVEALTDQSLTDNESMITRLFGRVETFLADRIEASVFGAWIQADDRPGASVMPSIRVTLPYDLWIDASASFSHRTLAMDASLWRWTQFGYTLPERPFLEDDSLHHEPPVGRITDLSEWPAPRLFTIDLDFGGRLPYGVDYLVGGYFRRSTNDYLADHEIAFSEATTGFLTNTTVVHAGSGELMGFHARLGLRLLRGFTQRITYVTESPVSGDELFVRNHARVPSHRVAFTTIFAPNDRFSLHARAQYHAATTWSDYAAASSASGGIYPWQLPERILLDVAATKRFWRDHLVANVSVRNLLNEPYRGHPAGAVFNMSFHFALQVSFNSEAGL